MIIVIDDSGAPPAGSTWDPALKGANIVLSNGDMDATKAAAGYQTVYGTQGRSSGHYAFEIVVVTMPSTSIALLGIADKTNSASMVATYIGNNSGPVEALGWNDSPSRYFRRMTVGNVNGAGTGIGFAAGDVCTVGVNIASNTISLYRNGSLVTPSPIAITSGKTYFPAASLQSGAVLRLRTTGLSYPPSGATDWG